MILLVSVSLFRKQEKKMSTYSQFREEMETGDLILFSGKGKLSAGIKLGSLCRWSHIGMAFVKVQNPDIALIYQATPSTIVKDFFSQDVKTPEFKLTFSVMSLKNTMVKSPTENYMLTAARKCLIP